MRALEVQAGAVPHQRLGTNLVTEELRLAIYPPDMLLR